MASMAVCNFCIIFSYCCCIAIYIAYKSNESNIDHSKKSVTPLLSLFPKGEKDTKEYGVYLSNQGLGPAKVNSIKINNQYYYKIDSMDWLDLFYKAEIEAQKAFVKNKWSITYSYPI
ncbi:hypothetical protein [Neisseria chenwenguii]|uniref:hypothetical protein n=1 Tax=Neisseria chenwenguii TaxID=1853278 RepID=UPI000F50674B|nr:hypothetical protein [Neisseria chenwenguii]